MSAIRSLLNSTWKRRQNEKASGSEYLSHYRASRRQSATLMSFVSASARSNGGTGVVPLDRTGPALKRRTHPLRKADDVGSSPVRSEVWVEVRCRV